MDVVNHQTRDHYLYVGGSDGLQKTLHNTLYFTLQHFLISKNVTAFLKNRNRSRFPVSVTPTLSLDFSTNKFSCTLRVVFFIQFSSQELTSRIATLAQFSSMVQQNPKQGKGRWSNTRFQWGKVLWDWEKIMIEIEKKIVKKADQQEKYT